MNLLEVLLGEALGGVARMALALDPEHQTQLSLLEGQSLQIRCSNPPQHVTLRVAAGAMNILPGSDNPVDATVTGSLTDLIALVRGNSTARSLQLSGDAAVLQNFERLFASYKPDLSALLPAGLRDTGAQATTRNQGADLFEQFRGLAEVGIQSVGRALQTLTEGVRSSADSTTHTAVADYASASARLQQLHATIAQLNGRVDQLDPNSNQSM